VTQEPCCDIRPRIIEQVPEQYDRLIEVASRHTQAMVLPQPSGKHSGNFPARRMVALQLA